MFPDRLKERPRLPETSTALFDSVQHIGSSTDADNSVCAENLG
jgi:hypothetical protein